jgi:hypothetical protein
VIELEEDDDEIVFISSNPLWKNESQDQDDRSGQPDLSFLTGANSLVLGDVAHHPPGNKKGPAPTKDPSSNQHARTMKAALPLLTSVNKLSMSSMEALPFNKKKRKHRKVSQEKDCVSLLNCIASSALSLS